MAITSGFFMSVNGDRKYKADFFARYFASFIGNGVFPNPSTNLQIMSNDNMTITLKPGQGWINGYILFNDDDYILNIDVADGVLNRIDRVVLRYDTALRDVFPLIKKGTFASSPVAPTLQRDADAYELALADIKINKGVVSITQLDITDLRLDNSLCGIVHGVVDQVDVTTLFNQYAAGFEVKKEEFERDFMDWFNNLQIVLDGDVVGNLLNLINGVKNDLSSSIKAKKDVVILANGWIDDTLTSGFWIYEISDIDITEDTVVDVNIHLADLEKASDIKSSNLSSSGKVTLYADKEVEDDIVCDIKIVRQVV